jgi:hypothetical protein
MEERAQAQGHVGVGGVDGMGLESRVCVGGENLRVSVA